MKRAFACLFVLSVGLCVTQLGAGEKKSEKKDGPSMTTAKPGPEHAVLKNLAGNFDTKVMMHMGPETMESKGIMKRQSIMGGLYLKEEYDGAFMGVEFKGMGTTGYDRQQKKYVATWIDTMSTGIMIMQGTYDPKMKTISMTGEDIDPESGVKMKTRDVLKIVSADEQHSEMFRTPAGGKEMKVMTIHYTRQGKASDKK